MRDLQAEAETTLDALDLALSIARRTYQVYLQFASDAELWHYGGIEPHADRQLLVVGCMNHSPNTPPRVLLALRVLERLAAPDVRPVDLLRGEQLRGCLLGVAASLAPQHVHWRSARFVGEAAGGTIVVRQLAHEPTCRICQETEEVRHALIGRGQRRREIEHALQENRRVFVDASGGMPRR